MSLQDSVSTPVRRYRYIVNITSLCNWVPFLSSFLMKMSRGGGGRFFRSADLFCRGPERGLRFNGRCLLFVPLDAAFLFFFAVVGGVFKRLMF